MRGTPLLRPSEEGRESYTALFFLFIHLLSRSTSFLEETLSALHLIHILEDLVPVFILPVPVSIQKNRATPTGNVSAGDPQTLQFKE